MSIIASIMCTHCICWSKTFLSLSNVISMKKSRTKLKMKDYSEIMVCVSLLSSVKSVLLFPPVHCTLKYIYRFEMKSLKFSYPFFPLVGKNIQTRKIMFCKKWTLHRARGKIVSLWLVDFEHGKIAWFTLFKNQRNK